MTFALLIAGIILSVIAALITLILGIIHLSTGKTRSGLTLGVSFIMSTVVFVLCITEVVKRTSNKVKEGISWIKEHDKKYDINYNSNTTSNYSSDYYAFIPDSNSKNSISSEFYYTINGKEFFVPLVYPYRFVSDDRLKNANLESLTEKDTTCLGQLSNITDFTFDNHFLLAKRNNENINYKLKEDKKLPPYSYYIFDFSNCHCQEYKNENILFTKAEELGYNGKKYFSSVNTHYNNYEATAGKD